MSINVKNLSYIILAIIALAAYVMYNSGSGDSPTQEVNTRDTVKIEDYVSDKNKCSCESGIMNKIIEVELAKVRNTDMARKAVYYDIHQVFSNDSVQIVIRNYCEASGKAFVERTDDAFGDLIKMAKYE